MVQKGVRATAITPKLGKFCRVFQVQKLPNAPKQSNPVKPSQTILDLVKGGNPPSPPQPWRKKTFFAKPAWATQSAIRNPQFPLHFPQTALRVVTPCGTFTGRCLLYAYLIDA